MSRAELPSGTVTFLFTDVEGSTRLLDAIGAAGYADALADHRRVVRDAVARHGGVEVDTEGDAFFIAFPTAPGALAAAAEMQQLLTNGPIRVRIGIHTGTPMRVDTGYVGIDVHRAARIAAAGHGGQVLVSATTAGLVGAAGLRDLGEHRLKDLAAAERIFQLGSGSFPPLKTLSPSNLPVPGTPFLGRQPELEAITERLRDPALRLFTITGPGGVGKTRLALQAAAESSATFPGGLWWVALAPLRDPALVPLAIGQAVGVREEEGRSLAEAIAHRLAERRSLVLVDNAEHLLPDLADHLAPLMQASDGWTILATSRQRLQLGAERVFPVDSLSAADAEAFLRARAAAYGVVLEPSDALTALCERLDRLPLALQLAAARLPMFSAEQLLERLPQRLDLLKGERDADPRQSTLRATIAWSHDLLSSAEQTLFRRLAVFTGGWTYGAAEAVCDADVDTFGAVLDKSLVQRRSEPAEPRFWMLESIRDFAVERLDRSGDANLLRARHADWFRSLAARADKAARSGEPEEIAAAVLEADIDNIRSAVAFGLDNGDIGLVREVTASLVEYWDVRGRHTEARTWLERALSLDSQEDDIRRRLLAGLATSAHVQGDYALAISAADEAAGLALRLGGLAERYQLLRSQARAAAANGDVEKAEAFWMEAMQAAVEVDNGVGMSSCRINMAYLANITGRHDRAEALLEENLPFVRSRGQTRCEATTLASLAVTSVYRDRPEEAAEPAIAGARRAAQIGDDSLLAECLDALAAASAARGEAQRAAAILGATEAARGSMGVVLDPDETALRERVVDRVRHQLGVDAFGAALADGRALDLSSAVELATTLPS